MKKSHSENTVGPWTRQKLDGLESYLDAYTTALSKQRFQRVFIDAFAGAGKSRVRAAWSGIDESEIQLFQDETITQGEEEFNEGSPRRALSIRRPFHSYYFFDVDAARAELLHELRQNSATERSAFAWAMPISSDPAHVNIIASVLGHATLQMSERHYNRASGVKAAAAWQEVVQNTRRDAQRRARRHRPT